MRKSDRKIVTLEEIEKVWGGADFGEGTDPKKIVYQGLLKRATGYHNGHVCTCILINLGLITSKENLTKRGRYCLYEYFKGDTNV